MFHYTDMNDRGLPKALWEPANGMGKDLSPRCTRMLGIPRNQVAREAASSQSRAAGPLASSRRFNP